VVRPGGVGGGERVHGRGVGRGPDGPPVVVDGVAVAELPRGLSGHDGADHEEPEGEDPRCPLHC
ncbi:hypothetical protein EG859_15160, partial [Enterococcus faecalis]